MKMRFLTTRGLARFALCLVIFFAHSSATCHAQLNFPLGAGFLRQGLSGTFVYLDHEKGRYEFHNEARASEQFLPASTFKILNALIALETKVIADDKEVIVWDGKDRGLEQWNRDHDLASAISVSAVWFFQELARRVGPDRMRRHVEAAGYGNRDISGSIDSFWLDGALRVSALEQVGFLVRLYKGDLPFSKRNQEIVKGLIIEDRCGGSVFRAKTGWAMRASPQVGWYIGWVERDRRAYFFALNIDITENKQAGARFSITKNILTGKGLCRPWKAPSAKGGTKD